MALDLRDARCVSFRMCAIILLISNVRHEMSVELSNFSQQRVIAVVSCVVGTCNDNHPSRIHPLTGNKIVRMWLAISKVVSFVVDELRIRAWTEMKLSPADGHVEGGSGLSPLFSGLAASGGVSSTRGKGDAEVSDNGTFSASGCCHEHWLHAFDIVITAFFSFSALLRTSSSYTGKTIRMKCTRMFLKRTLQRASSS